MSSRLRRLCTRPLAALGGVALLAAVSATPSVSGASTGDADGPSGGDPDDATAGTATTGDGTFESCSGLFGFGKAFVAYDVLVDGADPATPLVRGVDFDLLLTGDLDDDGTTESCVPEDLTEADWNASVYGPDGVGAPFPGANHIVLPSVPDVDKESVRPVDVSPTPFTLSVVDLAEPYVTVVGEQSIENSVNPSAVLATGEAVAVGVIGEAALAAIQSAVEDGECDDRTEARAAAVELFDSMTPAFQDDWLSIANNLPDQCYSPFFLFLADYYPVRWVNYVAGTTAPAVFDLTVPGPGPGPGPGPTPGPAPTPDTPAVTPRYTG